MNHVMSYHEWECKVIEAVARSLDISHGDAAGVVEAQPFYMAQSWGKKLDAQQTAAKILGAAQAPQADTMIVDKQMANRNAQFLAVIDCDTRSAILESIAGHYGITAEQAFAEVADTQAEHLLEYMVEPQRTSTSVLMQRHGMRGW